MSVFPAGNSNTGAFRDYSPGPHSGVDPDAAAQVAPASLDRRARKALTLGVLSLVLGVVTGAPAIWVGLGALRHIHGADGARRGRLAAWAGIALGCLGVAGTLALWITLHRRT